jgi:hypothetical protein
LVSAAKLEKDHLDYYLADKAKFIAPIKSVKVSSYDGTTYNIVENGATLAKYGTPVTLTSGSGWT